MRAAFCHHYDVMWSCDIIDNVTIRLSIDHFLFVLNRNKAIIHMSYVA